MLGWYFFRLSTSLRQMKHSPRNFVLAFGRKASHGFQGFGKQFGHGMIRAEWTVREKNLRGAQFGHYFRFALHTAAQT